MSENPHDDNESQNPTAWDNLSESTPCYEDVRDKEREAATEKLKTLSSEYRAIEADFIEKHPQAKQKFADDPEKQTRYNKFFIEGFENKISSNRRDARANAELADIQVPYTLAQYDNIAINYDDRERSVEVQSGILFSERMHDLEAAIQQAGGNPEHTQLIQQTWPRVRDHIQYQHMSIEEVATDHERYDRQRTEAHNLMIDQLNAINNLAKQYGTRPFTCRNFATSRGYDYKRDNYEQLGKILRSDRVMVQQYFFIAFNRATKELIAKIEHENRSFH